ncbi:MAG: alpha/beta hydrolase [Clostridia bacterium]|nr:alpha/beta hydrolase [Clostridia bacterium]
MRKEEFVFNGHNATVILPDNPSGGWVWKTEFLYAFDQAERALTDKGYTRVYYQISDRFGSPAAVRLMRAFHKELLCRYSFLFPKPVLFGFSRGALYAFNYALYYPECVSSLYLDAPVLNLKSWPWPEPVETAKLFAEYNLCDRTFETFRDSPIDHLDEFFRNGLPILLVAGDSDRTVPFDDNGKIMADYYRENGRKIVLYLKKGCDHHPHSLEDVAPIVRFVDETAGCGGK